MSTYNEPELIRVRLNVKERAGVNVSRILLYAAAIAITISVYFGYSANGEQSVSTFPVPPKPPSSVSSRPNPMEGYSPLKVAPLSTPPKPYPERIKSFDINDVMPVPPIPPSVIPPAKKG